MIGDCYYSGGFILILKDQAFSLNPCNYWQLRSKHTLGLLLFASFLFIENALAFYFYMLDPVLHVWVTQIPTIAQRMMTLLRLFEFIGLAFLTWTSLD